MYEQTRKQLLDILEAVRANPDIYEYIGLKLRDLNKIKKELERETCPTYEVI